jgi:DNA repair protein RadC
LTASLASCREIFKGAILANAAEILIAHNHPSGNPSPSNEDIRLTKRLVEAGRIIGIEVVDHLIVAANGHYSFKTEAALTNIPAAI